MYHDHMPPSILENCSKEITLNFLLALNLYDLKIYEGHCGLTIYCQLLTAFLDSTLLDHYFYLHPILQHDS